MKHAILLLAIVAITAQALAQTVSSVVTCPGEDTSRQMRISWAADARGTYVLCAPKNTKMKKATKIRPETEFRCRTFDSVYSKTADNQNYYEHADFIKCGATLNGLKPDTQYRYVICDANGNAVSGEHHFKTAGAKEWSACIISDFHSYSPLQGRLKGAMQMVNTVEQYDPSMDWILHLGDVTAWGGSWSFWQRLYQEPQFSKYFWAGVNGNHDNMTRSYRLSNDFFRQANYMPENGYYGEQGVCYHFRYGEALFIMLNNEDMRKDAGLQAAQEWFKKVVTEARQSSDAPRYIIVCEHYQWFFGDNGKFSQYSRWNELFDQYGVDLALAGNNHIYLRSNAIYQGKVTDGTKGTVYIQSTSADNERGRDMDPELSANPDLVKYRWTEGPKSISAMSMKVNSKKITVTLLDRNGTAIDTVDIPSKK